MRGLIAVLCLLLALPGAALAAELPQGVTLQRNVAYGPDNDQKMDIYLPPNPVNAPILLMVHGGGWRRGDKGIDRVVDNKLARWAPKGIIFVSINYRMQPEAPPLVQAEDVARALAEIQKMAPGLGGDPNNVILMGHSAGAHLVALLNADPKIATDLGARLWKGVVSLDSGALDVPQIMEGWHPKLYDEAFGDDPSAWAAASPYHRLNAKVPPLMAICREGKSPCAEARAYNAKAKGFGNEVEILPIAKSHGEINADLGTPGAYTDAVEAFMRKLGWGV